ncbi:FAD-binding protein, partial [Streptomyces pilosus]
MGSTASARNGTWRNWGGTVSARPAREASPASVEELAAVVRRAAEDGLPVKAVGSGHSFTSIAATDGVLIRPDLLTGIRDIDREAGTVTVEAGTPLRRLNVAHARAGQGRARQGAQLAAP